MSARDAKQALRATIRARLADVTFEQRAAWSAAACAHLRAWGAFERAGTVFAFVSSGLEVDTTALIEAALATGKRVCVPRIGSKGEPMRAVAITSLAACEPGFSGLLEPRAGTVVAPSDIDLTVAPGLAFDRRGGRLGQGGGYYDRFLGRGGVVAAIAFVLQVVDDVPREAHDRAVDAVATEQGLIEV